MAQGSAYFGGVESTLAVPSRPHTTMSFKMSSASSGMGVGPSGMGVADEFKQVFRELQRKNRYIIFKIEEKSKQVVVDKTGGPAGSYDDFTASLPENDCRYAMYDFDFVTSENCQKSKRFFISWSPDQSRIRTKMLYAASKERIRRELDGVHYEIQATDLAEIDIGVIRD